MPNSAAGGLAGTSDKYMVPCSSVGRVDGGQCLKVRWFHHGNNTCIEVFCYHFLNLTPFCPSREARQFFTNIYSLKYPIMQKKSFIEDEEVKMILRQNWFRCRSRHCVSNGHLPFGGPHCQTMQRNVM